MKNIAISKLLGSSFLDILGLKKIKSEHFLKGLNRANSGGFFGQLFKMHSFYDVFEL